MSGATGMATTAERCLSLLAFCEVLTLDMGPTSIWSSKKGQKDADHVLSALVLCFAAIPGVVNAAVCRVFATQERCEHLRMYDSLSMQTSTRAANNMAFKPEPSLDKVKLDSSKVESDTTTYTVQGWQVHLLHFLTIQVESRAGGENITVESRWLWA